MRGDLWREAKRLSNLPEVRNFVNNHCVRVEGPETVVLGNSTPFNLIVADNHSYYEYSGRSKNKSKVAFKAIIRDNILPALANNKVPHAWGDLEDKIEALELIIRIVMVPRGDKPWLPEPAQGGQGQGQGQGQGGPPSN